MTFIISANQYFNSTLVRLKAVLDDTDIPTEIYFNSTLVRLKVLYPAAKSTLLRHISIPHWFD